jgi:uncharacterized membrane protein
MSRSTAPSDAAGPGWRGVALAAGLSAYALLSYLLMTRWPDQPWTIAALFGPLLAGMGAAGLARRHGPTLLATAALAALVAAIGWRGGIDVQRLYVLQHAALHALMGFGFGITLRPGATPLITQLAERLHQEFTPEMRLYTRQLTAAWALYFVGMIVVSALLYLSAPWSWWSFFCNILTPLAAVLVFVCEYAWRYHRHPEFERVSMAQAVQAWRRFRA